MLQCHDLPSIICISRAIKNPDSDFSMEIGEFAQMVKDVKHAIQAKGNVHYGPNLGEQGNLKFRRSLFAVKDIKKGEKFSIENVRSIRPSNGMAPKYYAQIIGKTAKCDIAYGEPLQGEMVEGFYE